MNTAQLKVLSWGAALLFGAGLAGYVGYYLMNRPVLEKRMAGDEIKSALSKVPNVEKKAEDIVAYDKVNQVLNKMSWTAKKPPPPPKPVDDGPKPQPPGTEPVSSLVRVLLFKADSTDDSGSRAVIKYLPPSKVVMKEQAVVKHVGDTLDAPCQWVTVDDITETGVWFKFSDSKRPRELVTTNEFANRLDMEALARKEGGSSLVRPPVMEFKKTSTYGTPPEHTVAISPDRFEIGTTDMDDWGENYEKYINEVDIGRHRDPTTGKYDGISISNVPPGSMAAAHGVKDGDVIKSINGTPVNSQQEALSYVKNNKDKYVVWDVVIESKGKLRTVTYKVPKKK